MIDQYLQEANTNQDVWLRQDGTKHNVVDGETKPVSQVLSAHTPEHDEILEYRAAGSTRL